MTSRILVVDDEPELRAMLRLVLERAGYHVDQVENGLRAVEFCRATPPDLVVMDVNMPVLDGIRACRQIRAFSSLPVVLLTVNNEEEILEAGFSAGAYDFLGKPFRPRELLARVASQLERAGRAQPGRERQAAEQGASYHSAPRTPGWISPRLTYADLSLDTRSRRVLRGNAPVSVTAVGFQLLQYFMHRPGEVITKESLLRDVWGCPCPNGGENMVEAAIKRLRKELGDDSRQPRYIKTVWGMGYRFGEQLAD